MSSVPENLLKWSMLDSNRSNICRKYRAALILARSLLECSQELLELDAAGIGCRFYKITHEVRRRGLEYDAHKTTVENVQ